MLANIFIRIKSIVFSCLDFIPSNTADADPRDINPVPVVPSLDRCDSPNFCFTLQKGSWLSRSLPVGVAHCARKTHIKLFWALLAVSRGNGRTVDTSRACVCSLPRFLLQTGHTAPPPPPTPARGRNSWALSMAIRCRGSDVGSLIQGPDG